MQRFVLTLLATLSLAATGGFAEDKPSALDRDRKALQGVWVVEAAHRDGEKVPDNERTEGPILYALKITDDKFQIALQKSGDEFSYGGEPVAFRLDVSVDPKVIEFEFNSCEKGYCIYALKDGKLILCFNYSDGVLGQSTKDRAKLPKKLETKKGDGSYMFVLKKQKEK